MIRYAIINDLDLLTLHDKHVSKEELINIINSKRIILLFKENKFVGWLRYNLFWDNTPFLNMLFIMDGERNKGYGSELISFWESEMKKVGYHYVLTSTQSNETAQFFYRKLGYKDSGSLELPREPLEIIFYKEI